MFPNSAILFLRTYGQYLTTFFDEEYDDITDQHWQLSLSNIYNRWVEDVPTVLFVTRYSKV